MSFENNIKIEDDERIKEYFNLFNFISSNINSLRDEINKMEFYRSKSPNCEGKNINLNEIVNNVGSEIINSKCISPINNKCIRKTSTESIITTKIIRRSSLLSNNSTMMNSPIKTIRNSIVSMINSKNKSPKKIECKEIKNDMVNIYKTILKRKSFKLKDNNAIKSKNSKKLINENLDLIIEKTLNKGNIKEINFKIENEKNIENIINDSFSIYNESQPESLRLESVTDINSYLEIEKEIENTFNIISNEETQFIKEENKLNLQQETSVLCECNLFNFKFKII